MQTCDFYPRPPRGGRRGKEYVECSTSGISIHALREEGDLRYPRPPAHQGISIHALREEGDPDYRLQDNDYSKFLSTPSARRATIFIRSGMALLLFLSTPSARRATGASVAFDQYEGISIHALREEGDTAPL